MHQRRAIHPGRAIHPALIAILSEGFLSRLSFGIISFVLPLYAYRRLGLSLSSAGLLLSFNLIAEQLFKPLMGWLADRWGLRPTFTTAIVLRSVVALLFVFAAAPWQVFAIRFLHGFSESMRDPSVNALIAEFSHSTGIASSYAWYNTAKLTAGASGKALGGLILATSGESYQTAFAASFALSILPLYVVARYVREPEATAKSSGVASASTVAVEEVAASASPTQTSGRQIIAPIALLGFFVCSTAHLIQGLFPILATEYGGLSVSQTASIYAISVAVVLISGPVFGWIADNISRQGVLMIRGLANSISSLLYWFAPGMVGFTIGTLSDSLGKAAFRPAWGSLMATVAGLDRKKRAQTMSWLGVGEGMGETMGPLIGGLLWQFWGLPALFGTRLALAIGTEIYSLRVNRKIKSLSSTSTRGETNAHLFSDGTTPQSELSHLPGS